MTVHHAHRFHTVGAIAFTTTALLTLAALSNAAAAPSGATASAPKDPCGGAPRCYNAGAFTAEVVQVSPTAMTGGARHHSVSINIRFRNVSDKPVILAYQSGSSAALDNFGNAFTWGRPGTHDTSVKGIGMVTGRTADTHYSLAPGQSRDATYGIIRFNAKPPIGNAWNYNVVIEEIEIQPGQVVRSVRQNSVSFSNVMAGSFPAVSDAAVAEAGGTSTAGQGDPIDVANKMIDLFKRAHKKP
jgi:hypothetical protein